MNAARLRPIDRRNLLALLAGGGALATLGACSENAATGRQQFVMISDADLAQLADQAWADLLAQTPRAPDNDLQAQVRGIGMRFADATGRNDLDWDFVVFDSPEINAFILPNGKVGVFKGLVDFARGAPDEIAAVMGHEAGHIVARHAAERMTHQLAVQTGVGVAQLLLSERYGEQAADIAAALGMGAVYGVILPYSRKHEFEADRLGAGLARQVGEDPAGAVRFWERMIAANADRAQPLPFLSTHPADGERLAALRNVVATG
jgi:predicted Zn-dependent protease